MLVSGTRQSTSRKPSTSYSPQKFPDSLGSNLLPNTLTSQLVEAYLVTFLGLHHPGVPRAGSHSNTHQGAEIASTANSFALTKLVAKHTYGLIHRRFRFFDVFKDRLGELLRIKRQARALPFYLPPCDIHCVGGNHEASMLTM